MASRQSLIGNFADESGVSRQPFAYLSVDRGGTESRKIRTLIDTGSEIIVLEKTYALRMLGISAEQLASSAIKLDMIVIGGKTEIVRGWKANLRLRSSDEDADYLFIPGAIVYVRENVLPAFPGLFGQLSGLQERFLAHYNHSRKGFWQLKG